MMKKLIKIFIYVIIGISILIGIIYFASGPILKKIISNKLDEKRISGIYKVKMRNAHLNILQMGIDINGIELYPDSSEESKKIYPFFKNIVHITVKRISLTNLDLIELFQNKKININKIRIIEPTINLYKNDQFKTASTQNTQIGQSDTLNQIATIDLNNIIIKNLNFNYFLDKDNKSDISVGKIDLELIHPKLDINKLHQPIEALTLENMFLKVHDILFQDIQGFYTIKAPILEYNYQDNIFTINDFSVKPNFDKKKFAAKNPYQIDRLDLSIDKTSISGFDIKKFIDNNILSIKEIGIDGLNLEDYRDKNHPFNNNNFPKLPQQALKESKQKIEIEKISILSSHIVYLELAENASKVGKVEFNNLQGVINNVGNTQEWQKSKSLKANIHTMLYDKGKLNVQFEFPLSSNTFYFSGQLGQTPMKVFNEMTIPAENVKIAEGTIQKMNFKASANSKSSSGELNLYYSDLKIAMLKKPNESGEIKENKVVNFLANNLIVPKSNPNRRGKFYSATISQDRDPNKGVFNYLWKSIFSGIKDTFVKNNKEKDDRSTKKSSKKNR